MAGDEVYAPLTIIYSATDDFRPALGEHADNGQLIISVGGDEWSHEWSQSELREVIKESLRKAAPSISRIASTYEEVDAGADGSNLQFFVELAAKSLDALRDAGLPLVLGYFGHKAAKSTSNRRADRRAEAALALTDEEYERKAKAALYKRYQIPFSEMQAEVSRIDSDGGGGVKVTLPDGRRFLVEISYELNAGLELASIKRID